MSAMVNGFGGIDHVQVAIPPGSEDACRAYYVGVVGFVEIVRPATLAAGGGIWLAVGPDELHLGVEPEFQPARKAHPAFGVADIDGLAERIGAAGYDVRWSKAITGSRRFHTADPLGNRLEFIQTQS